MRTLKILGFATLLLIAGPAVIMEALYVSQMLGAGLAAAVMLAAVIGFHLLKALLPFLAASDLPRASRAAVWTLWVGLVLLSLVASVGFLSLEREMAFTRRLGASAELQAMEASLATDRARLGRLSQLRDARVIEADMAAALMTAGAATRHCDASVPATAKVSACRDVARLRVELEEARAADRLRASIAEAEGRLGWKVQTSGADPQAEVFVRLTGANVRAVQTALIVRADREKCGQGRPVPQGKRWLMAEKVKDGEEGEVFSYSLRVVELGTDTDGEAVTTCLVQPVTPPKFDADLREFILCEVGKAKASGSNLGVDPRGLLGIGAKLASGGRWTKAQIDTEAENMARAGLLAAVEYRKEKGGTAKRYEITENASTSFPTTAVDLPPVGASGPLPPVGPDGPRLLEGPGEARVS